MSTVNLRTSVYVFWVSAQSLSHSSIFFPCPVWSLCSVRACPKQLLGAAVGGAVQSWRGACACVGPQLGGRCSITSAQDSSLVALTLQRLSPALPALCVTWAVARTRSGTAVDLKLPDLKSRGKALTWLSFSAWWDVRLKGCSGTNREAKMDCCWKKWSSNCIKKSVFFRYALLSHTVTSFFCCQKEMIFPFFSQYFHAELNLCSLES